LVRERSAVHSTLPKWIGWDKLHPTYTATVTIPDGIKNVIIDPTERLADINMLNNRKRGNVELRFDSRIYPPASWTKYRLYMRPDFWWNAYDGLKVGINLQRQLHERESMCSAYRLVNSHLAQGGPRYYISKEAKLKAGYFSYRFDYQNAIDKVMKRTTFYFHSRWLDGCEMYKIGLTKQFPKNFSADINVKAFTRNKEEWRNYLLYPSEWMHGVDRVKRSSTYRSIISATYAYSKESFTATSQRVCVRGHLLLRTTIIISSSPIFSKPAPGN
jgi:hypothetical protein